MANQSKRHPYLTHSRVCSIQSWAEKIPDCKSPKSPTSTVLDTQPSTSKTVAMDDPAVQAYIQMKMALFAKTSETSS
jgi:hypothetical protein